MHHTGNGITEERRKITSHVEGNEGVAASRIIFWAHVFRFCLVAKPDPRWRPSVAKQLTVIFTARNSTEIPLR